MKLTTKCGSAAAKALILAGLYIITSVALQGCSKAGSTATDDAALRAEFKKPRSINDVPPDKRAMVEGILKAQREGRAPNAPKASPK